MKRIILSMLAILTVMTSVIAKDSRTLETKVADILAQLPVKELSYKDKLMQEITDLGESGIEMFCDMIIEPGTGDDTQARYAIESLTRYTASKNCTKADETLAEIFLSEMASTKSIEIKKFYLRRLNLIAQDSNIDKIVSYIEEAKLSTSVIATLQSIGTDSSLEAIMNAIPSLGTEGQITAIKSMGDMKYAPSYGVVSGFVGSSDATLKSSALYTISKLGNQAAYPILLKEAKEVGFVWGSDEALTSFATFTKEMGRADNMDLCSKGIKALLKAKDQSIQAGIYALEMMALFEGYDANSTLMKEFASSSNKRYRCAILDIAADITEINTIREWITVYKAGTPAQQEELINFFSSNGSSLAFKEVIKPAVNSNAANVRAAALVAVVAEMGDCAYSTIIEYTKSWSSKEDIAAVKRVLKSGVTGASITKLGNELDSASGEYKTLFVESITSRRATKWFNKVYSIATGAKGAARSAAISGISQLSTAENTLPIIELLDNSTDGEEIKSVQEALMSCIDEDSSSASFETVLASVSTVKRPENFYRVVANRGGAEALAVITEAYNGGTSSQKDAAYTAMSSWVDSSSLYPMLNIIRDGRDSNSAIFTFIKAVSKSAIPAQQKLLLLKEALSQTSDKEIKQAIIAAAGNTKTFLSLKFVAEFLDDADFANTAGKAAMTIALPTPGQKNGLTGEFVKEVLTKTVEVISGGDSQYWKIDINTYLENMGKEEGYVSMFDGKTLNGWKGFVTNPIKLAEMSKSELKKKQAEANIKMLDNWSVKDGCIWFSGKGQNLLSDKEYGDFEMVVDWKITPEGDSGLYLRGTPQIQIWDTSRVEVGAQVGSGGLYNNQKHARNPLKVADNPINEWNTFNIKMIGEKVTVYLNGELVVDNVTMENYWNRGFPILEKGTIELQAHGTDLAFKNIYVKEIDSKGFNLTDEEKSEGFYALFNGQTLDMWQGNLTDYQVLDSEINVDPKAGGKGNLYTKKEYDNFIFRFEFQLTPGANNGLGIHAPLSGDAAYVGKELQILDNSAAIYANLNDSQYHGSVYGVIAAKRGAQKPVGEWNYEEVEVRGDDIKITLNGVVIVDGNMAEASKNGTLDHKDHPGLKRHKGHIAFLGHGSPLKFRNIRIKEL